MLRVSYGRFICTPIIALCLLVASACQHQHNSNTQKTLVPGLPASAPSPCAHTICELYWGDVHLHSSLSFDAYLNGTRLVSPDEAYRFARGESVLADSGEQVRLSRPLDFLSVADHAENLGLYDRIDKNDPLIADTEVARRWREVLALVREKGLRAGFMEAIKTGGQLPNAPPELARSVWQDVTAIADYYNEPGRFTTLIGYEWTGMVTGDNLHRVILYRDGAERATQVLPFSTHISNDPEDLWDALAEYENLGGSALAIPHNGNLSNGRMFAPVRLNGEKIDQDYARKRARWEPLIEVTQVKGDSETHPNLSPNDEFANFERWDTTNVNVTTPKTPEMLPYEYARSGLLQGLVHEHETGENPFKYGLIGSSDAHTGLAAMDEDNFQGKFLASAPGPSRGEGENKGPEQQRWELGASGLTAVWAPQNHRADIFDGLKRREVYGTTGTRIALRFFGGWAFTAADAHTEDFASVGYTKGVPMGGDLPQSTAHQAPTFLVQAQRDPQGANLDRIQIVKGWIDHHGDVQERVFDIALSDNREIAEDGSVPALASTVNPATATYQNSVGAAHLNAYWQDPQFNADESAFYYIRVLEIHTPRWTTYDHARYGTKLADDVPRSIQERAYSSPIWYRPTDK